MAPSARTLRIVAASFVALLMVGVSYAVSGPVPFLNTDIVAAQSAEELLREYAVKDTDNDALPDWQEALYGTDPANPESFQAGMRDGDAVAQGLIEPKVSVREPEEPTDLDTVPGTAAAPSSLTDRFAQTLLKQYLATRGNTPPTTEEIVAFVEAGVAELAASSAAPNHYSASDVRIAQGSGAAALTTYAAEAEAAFRAHTVPAQKTELFYFEDALRGDAEALDNIAAIGDAYENIAEALIAIPVPQEARAAHLSIVNALMHLSGTSADMATLESDPLRALMGIGLQDTYATELLTGFSGLHLVFTGAGVSIPEGAPGYYIANSARDAAAVQQ